MDILAVSGYIVGMGFALALLAGMFYEVKDE